MSKSFIRKKNFIIFTVIIFIFYGFSAFALEINYPKVPGMQETPKECLTLSSESETKLACFVKYIYYFSLSISGLICFFTIVFGGFLYLISQGSVSMVKDARERILAGFIGISLLLFSYALLKTINPQLLISRLQITPAPSIPLVPMLPPQIEGTVFVEIPYAYQIEKLKGVMLISQAFASKIYSLASQENLDNKQVSLVELSKCLGRLTDMCRCSDPTENCQKDRTNDTCTLGECKPPCDKTIPEDTCNNIDKTIVLPTNLKDAISQVSRRIKGMNILVTQTKINLAQTENVLRQELIKLEAAEFLMTYSVNNNELYDTPISLDNFRVLKEKEKITIKKLEFWQDPIAEPQIPGQY